MPHQNKKQGWIFCWMTICFPTFRQNVESLQRRQHSTWMPSIKHYKYTATTWRCYHAPIKISPGKSGIKWESKSKKWLCQLLLVLKSSGSTHLQPKNSTGSCGRYKKSFIVLQARRFGKSVRNIPRKHLSIVPERSFRDAEDSSDEWNTTDALGCKSGSELEVIELASADPSIVKRGITKTRLYNPSACVDWHWS